VSRAPATLDFLVCMVQPSRGQRPGAGPGYKDKSKVVVVPHKDKSKLQDGFECCDTCDYPCCGDIWVSKVFANSKASCRYMALEYASSGKLTEKSNAFSFGVALFELITGLKRVDALRALGERALSTR
jgi:hypothetical protein